MSTPTETLTSLLKLPSEVLRLRLASANLAMTGSKGDQAVRLRDHLRQNPPTDQPRSRRTSRRHATPIPTPPTGTGQCLRRGARAGAAPTSTGATATAVTVGHHLKTRIAPSIVGQAARVQDHQPAELRDERFDHHDLSGLTHTSPWNLKYS